MKVAAPSNGSLRPELPKRELVAVVPAYNEEQHIGATVESLLRQTRPLDRIVVVADNCTDRTASSGRPTATPTRRFEPRPLALG